MNPNNKKDGIMQVFRSVTDASLSAVPTFLSIDINGNLIIESFRKLIEYNSKSIILNTGTKQVYIYGEKLCIKSFSRTQLQIDGKITKIEFSEV